MERVEARDFPELCGLSVGARATGVERVEAPVLPESCRLRVGAGATAG